MSKKTEMLYHCQLHEKWAHDRPTNVFFWAENYEGVRELLKEYISKHMRLVYYRITPNDFYIYDVYTQNDTQVIRDKLKNG